MSDLHKNRLAKIEEDLIFYEEHIKDLKKLIAQGKGKVIHEGLSGTNNQMLKEIQDVLPVLRKEKAAILNQNSVSVFQFDDSSKGKQIEYLDFQQFDTVNLSSLKLARNFEAIPQDLLVQVSKLAQLKKIIDEEKSKVKDLIPVLNFEGFSEDEIAEIETQLANPIPTKWVEKFGDVSLRALFEGETQRFFAKGMIDQNGIERANLFYGKNRYLPCETTLYLILDLPNYKDYQRDGGDYQPNIVDYSPEHEDKLNEADAKLTKAIIAAWQQHIAETKVPRLLAQLSAITV